MNEKKKQQRVATLLLTLSSNVSAFKGEEKEEELWLKFLDCWKVLDEVKRLQIQKAEETVKPDWEALKRWLEKDPAFKADGLEIGSKFEEGNGLVATRNIKKGEALVTLSRKQMICASDPFPELGRKVMEEDPLLKTFPNFSLAMKLLLHKHSPSSSFAPYIKILPTSFNSMFEFSLEEIQELLGTPFFYDVMQAYKNTLKAYCYLFAMFGQNGWNQIGVSPRWFTWQEFSWGISCLMSRQNLIRSSLSLIPFWDLFNHSPGQFTTFFDETEDLLHCSAMRDFPKGQQVFIYYGERTSRDLVLQSGFFLQNNPDDSIKSNMILELSDPLLALKIDILASAGFKHHGSGRFQIELRHQLNEESRGRIATFFRVFALQPSDVEGKAKEEVKKDILTSTSTLPTDEKAIQLATRVFTDISEQYKYSAQELKKNVEGKNVDATDRMMNIWKLKLREKEIITFYLDRASALFSPLSSSSEPEKKKKNKKKKKKKSESEKVEDEGAKNAQVAENK